MMPNDRTHTSWLTWEPEEGWAEYHTRAEAEDAFASISTYYQSRPAGLNDDTRKASGIYRCVQEQTLCPTLAGSLTRAAGNFASALVQRLILIVMGDEDESAKTYGGGMMPSTFAKMEAEVRRSVEVPRG